MSFFNPYDRPIEADLRLALVAVDEREVVLEHNDRPVRSVRAGETPVEIHLPRLMLAPGVNRFLLHTPQRPVRLGTGRYSLRTFGLTQAAIRVDPATLPPR